MAPVITSMLSTSAPRRSLIASIAIAALLVLASSADLATTQASSQPAAALSTVVKIVYLPGQVHPVVSPASLRGLGVTVATSPTVLATVSTNADAIMIDDSQLTASEGAWLASQYQQSTVVVGLNVASNRLERLIGFSTPFELATFRQGWNGRPFYTLEWKGPPSAGTSEIRRQSDVINTPGELVGRVQRVVQDGRQPLNQPGPVSQPQNE